MFRFHKEIHNKKIWRKLRLPELAAYRPLNYNKSMTVIPSRQYSQRSEYESGRSGRKFLLAIGALVAGGGATLAYAKNDDDFRRTLKSIAPFTDSWITVLWQEDSKSDTLVGAYYESVKGALTGLIYGESSQNKQHTLPPEPPIYKAPPSIVPILEKDVKKLPLNYTAVKHDTLEEDAAEPTIEMVEETKPKSPEVVTGTTGDTAEAIDENIVKLEKKISESAEEAINAYNKAISVTKLYNSNIEYIVDEAVNEIRQESWEEIRNKTKAKVECVKRAKEKADVATKEINKLKTLVSGRNFNVSDSSKKTISDNIAKVQDEIESAKKELDREQQIGRVSEKYWDKVEKARQHFSEELESLFPTIDLSKKELTISQEDMDLFVLHAYANVLFYQKELAKMETIVSEKMRQAVESVKNGGGETLTEAQICEVLEQEKRRLALSFQQQVLKLRREHDLEMREVLKRQSQTFTDHLEDAVTQREDEIHRCLSRKFDELLENERCKAKLQISAVVGRLKGIDQALQDKHKSEEVAKQSQILWSACQALLRALRSGCPGLPWKEQIRPLEPEIRAVEKAAAEQDDLVCAVINGIPNEARQRGVYPEDALRERFLKVEKVARTVALVPAEGAALPIHLLSFIQSLLLINVASPIPQAELNDEKVDFSKFNTNEILQRARYWLDRGDFAQTLRYMNLLKGAPRCVAREWMNETRLYLETRQAANTLIAYATSSSLSYL